MRAIVFALTALENGRRVGHAVICADTRYVTVQHAGVSRLERRFVATRNWAALDHALASTLEPGPLPADGVISMALLPAGRRRSTIVQYLFSQDANDGPNAAAGLDSVLRGVAGPSALYLDQL